MRFCVISELEKGIASNAYLALDKESDRMCTLKVFKSKAHSPTETALDSTLNEIQALRKFEHPNIIKFYAVDKCCIEQECTKEDPAKKSVVLSLEYLPNGDIGQYMKIAGPFKEKIARYYFKQLIDGLDHVHKSGFAHRNITLESLLLSQDFNLKISSFGSSFPLEKGQPQAKVGSFPYKAPELLSNEPHGLLPSDIFACGMVLFYMVTGTFPFDTTDKNNIIYQLIANHNWEEFWDANETPENNSKALRLSDSFKQLFQKLVANQPEDRFSINDIKHCKWYLEPTASPFTVKSELERRKKELKSQEAIQVIAQNTTTTSSFI